MSKIKSDFIFYWDALILLLITYAAIEVPLHLLPAYKPSGVLYILAECILSLCFIIDIYVRYHDPKTSHKSYLKRWSLIDILPAIPFELLLVFGDSGFEIPVILRAFRIVKIFRVASFKPLWEYSSNLNPGIVRLGFFFYYLALGMHWISCGWIKMRMQGMGGSLINEYLNAFYWCTTTVTTIGYGDITPDHSKNIEILYTMAVQFLGAGAYGYTIGNIATLLTNIDVARIRHRERVDRVANFMKSKKMPKKLQERVHHYYNYLWESRQGYDDATILSELPDSFKYEFASLLNREILRKVPMFKGADPNLIREIAVCLKPCIYTPGDAVCTYGEIGDKMYFINKGSVEVMSQDGRDVYATLKDGDFFGELALLLKQPRNATIKAVGYCDLYSLSKESFDLVISNYPDFEQNIQKMASERMNNKS
ncbi:MAG: putative transcriptional regulator, Crp/Fnr family [Flavipsychrobacter sp.]|jgi:voltage-gated potassium channel|nr:putative transcriptional regulator, Crp/Fnr family [Flavipsychrobacter sp.]